VPILPGYDGRGQSNPVLRREASRVGYPILVKPSAGGGGKGMHVVRAPAELGVTLAVARREAAAAFGDDRLILERYLERPRHVEVQLLLDRHGNGVHLGERDCSLQRRHQKVIEESPAPGVGPELRTRLGTAALQIARAAGYVGVGTAEFLLDDDGTFVFLEMNARLQVEHPVTEAVTGIDLVEAQLRVAAGEPLWLRQEDIRVTGHAIEARLYAEDPWNAFLPAIGRAIAVRWPSAPGIRVDAGIGEGDEVGTRYDPLLAKIVASGPDRATALTRLVDALAGTRTIGVTTNRGFLITLLATPAVVNGSARTDTIDARWRPHPELPDAVWDQAAAALGVGNPGSGAAGPGFRLNGPRRMAVELDGLRRIVEMTPRESAYAGASDDAGGVVFDVDGRAVRARRADPPTVDATLHAAHHVAGATAPITAPMPGTVTRVSVRAGQSVEAHEVLLVLEAMKMENAITAPVDGIVERLLVAPGQGVQRGDVLVELAG
jgi:acetyl-CoA/propionyl-CoA carboxylase biotin carboxyl carrier protein